MGSRTRRRGLTGPALLEANALVAIGILTYDLALQIITSLL